LRIHLIDPRALSYGSIMPGYSYLFRDGRRDDLVAYLESLRNPGSVQHLESEIATWRPAADALEKSRAVNGTQLFREHCATCHDPDGYVRLRWGSGFKVLPPDLAANRLADLENKSASEKRLRLDRIIHFGIPGTDMPGHEYFSDAQTEALAAYVLKLRTTHTP
jgi:cytochrome c oxidase cbb3-type subunit 2